MTKLLGYIKLNDNNSLNKLANELSLVLDNEAVWEEAKAEFESGNEQAEIRINGLDYILVEQH